MKVPDTLYHNIIIVLTFCNFADAGLLFEGQELTNNSVVVLSDIGEEESALYCITDEEQCCSSSETGGSELGNWFFPTQDEVDTTGDIYSSRGASAVWLNRRNNAQSPTGVYRCEIPDATGDILSFYTGVFATADQGDTDMDLCPLTIFNTFLFSGAPSIQSVQFELTSATDAATPSFTLDCITAGGPVDFNDITWTRDDSSLPINHGLFQVLDDGSTATYNNTLAVTGRETGQYSCQLQHSGNTTFMDITVEGTVN